MTDNLEDITFEEIGGLVDEEIEDLAADDPELATEVEDGQHGNDLIDADSESDYPPESADKEHLITMPDGPEA